MEEKPYHKVKIADGIHLLNLPADRFKTAEISVSMAVPLRANTAAENALVTYLLSRSCEEYPDFSKLNRRLAELYGAMLSVSITKLGENQLLKIGITALDDRFGLDETRISEECVRLFLSMLFCPNLENGSFRVHDVEMEKRLLVERIQSEENDKRLYALHRLQEEMFREEPYGVNPLGTVASVQAVTPESAMAAWVRVLTQAEILITVVGHVDNDAIAGQIEAAFSDIYRSYRPLPKTLLIPASGKVRTVEERQAVSQGKLVLGFRADMQPDDAMNAAMASAVDIFGGGPYSRLFANVREKLGLCYYCSARYVRAKGIVVVQCGCEEENMDKAIEEIQAQLAAVAQGAFTDDEFFASKMAVTDTILSYNDNPDVLESWYVLQMCEDSILTPEEKAARNNDVTREEIPVCAGKITLDTVYKLMSDKEGSKDE